MSVSPCLSKIFSHQLRDRNVVDSMSEIITGVIDTELYNDNDNIAEFRIKQDYLFPTREILLGHIFKNWPTKLACLK